VTRAGAAVLALAVAAVTAVATLSAERAWRAQPATRTSSEAAAATYQCPMHPQIVSHAPGTCPICGMDLTPIEGATARTAAATGPGPDAPHARDDRAATAPAGATGAPASRKVLFYRHPMRPDVTSPFPAKDEMGMDYTPVYEDESAGEGAAAAVPGRASFRLSAERQQLIGVTRERAEVRALESVVRTVGRVAYDPQLYRSVVEYREALRARQQVHESALAEAHASADAIVRGARLRLRQQGLSDAQIAQLGTRGADPVELLLPGDAVWVYAQVYENEAPLVAPGQTIVVTAPSQPGRTFTAKVAAVDSILDPATRTARVRALVRTPDASLRPESFVQVEIRIPLGEKLAVPRDAVLDTGSRQIAFVATDDGTFEPRSLTLGRAAGGYYEVLSGIAPGEQVVTSANFLIDSESRFRSAVAAFKPPATPAPAHSHTD